MRRFGPRIAAVAAVPLLVGAFGWAPQASADPGFCGVRVSGPDVISGSINVAYVVQNKCDRTWSFAIHFPWVDRTSPCAEVLPGGYKTFTNITVDPNWTVVNCP